MFIIVIIIIIAAIITLVRCFVKTDYCKHTLTHTHTQPLDTEALAKTVRESKRYFAALRTPELVDALQKIVNTVVHLPLSPMVDEYAGRFNANELRFHVSGNFIPVVVREAMQRLGKWVAEPSDKRRRFFLKSPGGWCKSYAMLYISAWLQQDPNNRVLYTPSCGDFDESVFINLLAHAFAEDQGMIRELETWTSSFSRKTARGHLEKLANYCRKKNLRFFALFDQHDSITKDEVDHGEFPISLPSRLADLLGSFPTTLLLSAASDASSLASKVVRRWRPSSRVGDYSLPQARS